MAEPRIVRLWKQWKADISDSGGGMLMYRRSWNLQPDEACHFLDCSIVALREMIARGELRAMVIGKRTLRIPANGVHAILERRWMDWVNRPVDVPITNEPPRALEPMNCAIARDEARRAGRSIYIVRLTDTTPTGDRPFYVYVLMRPSGKPFYVGKGVGDRVHQHEKEAARGCTCHKCRTIRKIQRSGASVIKSIVYVTGSEADALRYEAELIERIGIDNLTNIARGHTGILYQTKRARTRDYGDFNLNELRYHFTKAYGKGKKLERKLLEEHSRAYDRAYYEWKIARRQRRWDESDKLEAEMDALKALLSPRRITQQQLELD